MKTPGALSGLAGSGRLCLASWGLGLLWWVGCSAADPLTNPLRALSHKEPEVRRAAAELMGDSYESRDAARALPALSEALANDTDAEVRAASAQALGRLIRRHQLAHDQATIDALNGGLDDPDAEVRHASVVAMAGIGEEPPQLVPALFDALRSREIDVQEDADAALSRLPVANLDHLALLLEGVDDPEPAVRRASRMSLTQAALALEAGSAIARVVGAMAELDDPESRAILAETLGRFPDETSTARSGLVAALAGDPDPEVRASAARSLRRFAASDRGVADALRATTIEDRNAEVRIAAASALSDPDRSREEARQALLRSIEEELADDPIRSELASLIGPRARRSSGVDRLIELLEADDPVVRGLAARGLGVLGPRTEASNAAIEALIGALDDPETEVRVASADALGRFGPDARSAAQALERLAGDDSDPRGAAHAAAAGTLIGPPLIP